MTNFDRIKVYILNSLEQRVAEVDDFRSLKAKKVFNDVGSWTMEIDRASRHLVNLTTPMYGLDIYDHEANKSFLRGLIDSRQQKYDADTDTLSLTGFDDNQWLNWRLAHPSPAELNPPYTGQAYDVNTGQASAVLCHYADVNFGPSAIPARQITNVSALNNAAGTTITGRARWEVLLELLQDLAIQGGDIGFQIGRHATGVKQFQTYQPIDRTATVKFSVALGNLVGGTVKTTSPKGTYIFAAGTGDLTARTYSEGSNPGVLPLWGRREYFYDVNNLSTTGELDQAVQKALIEQGEAAEFAVQITDTANQSYGTDYDLGDKVTAIFVGSEPVPNFGIEGGQVNEIIREVNLTITPEDIRLQPTIGTPTRYDVFRIFREIRRLRTQLQRRQNN